VPSPTWRCRQQGNPHWVKTSFAEAGRGRVFSPAARCGREGQRFACDGSSAAARAVSPPHLAIGRPHRSLFFFFFFFAGRPDEGCWVAAAVSLARDRQANRRSNPSARAAAGLVSIAARRGGRTRSEPNHERAASLSMERAHRKSAVRRCFCEPFVSTRRAFLIVGLEQTAGFGTTPLTGAGRAAWNNSRWAASRSTLVKESEFVR